MGMNFDQVAWLRTRSDADLAEIAIKIAAEHWALFAATARSLHYCTVPDAPEATRTVVVPTAAEGVPPNVLRRCQEIYTAGRDWGDGPGRVPVVKYLRETYGVGLKEAKELMEDLERKDYLNYAKPLY
jgi:ribosomal protein L7/L12